MNKRRIIFLISAVLLGSVIFTRLAAAKRRAQSIGCASQIASICFAGRVYATDHNGQFPTNFICMSNELVTPKVLVCNADSAHTRATDFKHYTDANCSYVIVTPGVHEDATNTVFLRCSIHGHLGYPDGTLFDGIKRRGKFA